MFVGLGVFVIGCISFAGWFRDTSCCGTLFGFIVVLGLILRLLLDFTIM